MCIFYTREQQTIWSSWTLHPLSTLDVIHHCKADNLSLHCGSRHTFCSFSLRPYGTNFLSKIAHIVALQTFKILWWPGCRHFSKRDDWKGLIYIYIYVYSHKFCKLSVKVIAILYIFVEHGMQCDTSQLPYDLKLWTPLFWSFGSGMQTYVYLGWRFWSKQDLKVFDYGILLQVLYFLTLSIVLSIF